MSVDAAPAAEDAPDGHGRAGKKRRRRLALGTAALALAGAPAIAFFTGGSSAFAAEAGAQKKVQIYGSSPNDMRVEARQQAHEFCGGENFYFVQGLYNSWTLTPDKGWFLDDTAVCT